MFDSHGTHNHNPHRKPATMEDIQPTLDEIVLNIRALSVPSKSYYDEYGADAMSWAEVVEHRLRDCCAFHKVDELAGLQREMMETLASCKDDRCNRHSTHEFIQELIDAISKPMTRLIKRLTLEAMLRERTN